MPGDAPTEDGWKRPGRAFRRWLAVLFLVNLLARLPLCWDPGTVRNDGAEYLAVARSLRTTGSFATDLKYHFFTDDPVRHGAWADRPPLYPFVAVSFQKLLSFLDPVAAARVGNVLLACLALVPATLYLRRLWGETPALLAVGFTWLLPHSLYWTAQPMTEAVSLLLGFGALLLWSDLGSPGTGDAAGAVRSGRRTAFLAGLLTGLHYLARPTGALPLLAFGLDLGVRARTAEKGRAWLGLLVPLILGFLAAAAPYHLLLWRLYGSPLHSSLGYAFAVRTYYEVTYFGWERSFPGTAEFLRENWKAVPRLVLRQAWSHAQSLLLPLLALWPFAVLWRREDWAGLRRPAGVLMLLWIGVHTLVWSAWGSSRYFLLCLPILAAALVAAALHWGSRGPDRPPAAAALAFGLSGLGLLVNLGLFYTAQARADRGMFHLPAVRAAAEAVRGSGLVATDRPSTLNLLLSTPAVMLPRTTDPEQLSRFLRKFQPDALVLFVDEPQKTAAERMAEAWRRGKLPRGWRLVEDRGAFLVARPAGGGQSSVR